MDARPQESSVDVGVIYEQYVERLNRLDVPAASFELYMAVTDRISQFGFDPTKGNSR